MQWHYTKQGQQFGPVDDAELCRLAQRGEIAPDDLVVIEDVGAYALAMWSRYNSRQMPRVLGLRQGHFSVLREREEPEDLVRFWLGGSSSA